MPPHQVNHISIAGDTRRLYNNDFARHLRTPPSPTVARPDPVFAHLQSVFLVLKASGLMPIYEQSSSHEVSPSTRTHALYSSIVRLFFYTFSVYNAFNLYAQTHRQLFTSFSETDNVNKSIEVLMCTVMFGAIVSIAAKNGAALLKILNELLAFDAEVQREFNDTPLDDNCGFVAKFVGAIGGCMLYMLGLKALAIPVTITPTTYALLGFHALQNGLATIFMVFTAALLRLVTMRFAFLNGLLSGYTYAQQRKWPQLFIRRGGVRVDVRRAVDLAMASFPADALFAYRLHNSLLCIYKAINECCSLALVAYMGYAFYSITTTTYNLFVQVTTQRVSLNEMQWSAAWLTLHTTSLALVSRACAQATKEANATSQILARVYGKNKEYQHIIDKFLTKSVRQEVYFSANGFFIIDQSTLFKIFLAVTTYLVILIQFKQLEDMRTAIELAIEQTLQQYSVHVERNTLKSKQRKKKQFQ